jgi:RNA polymerase sigma factor (sigma-70 family)
MYVSKTHSPLTPFYAVASENTWQVNQESIKYLNRICQIYAPEFNIPTTLDLAIVDRYVNEHLSPSLINLIVTKLYQTFLVRQSIANNSIHRIWVNFIHYINSTRLVPRLWNQLPAYKRTNEKLELFQNAALLSPIKLFTNFNPEYDNLNLLNGIERWTYRSLRNFIYGQIRDRGEPLFGLTNTGVVAKLSLSYLRDTRSSYVSKERVILDTFLVQIFKNYLKRSRIRTNQLKLNDWEEIHREVDRQWHNLKLDFPPPSIEKIKQDLDIIGDCVRKDSEMQQIDSLDRGLNNDSNQTLGETILAKPEDNIDLEDKESVRKGCKQLRPVMAAAITKLDAIDSQILDLLYRQGLKQEEIGKKIGEDQPTVSKMLRKIYKHLLTAIHQQIDNPNNSAKKIDRISIAAMKQALKIFYQN